MMEFLLVLPIYLTLVGGTFAVGDMLIRSIKLASADRLKAMSPDEFQVITANAIGNDLIPAFVFDDDDNLQTSFSDIVLPAGGTYRTDKNFRGAWSWQTAGRVVDSYRAPMWTRAWIGFPADLFESTLSGVESRIATRVRGIMEKLKDLVTIAAMGRSERSYNYYTLKRTVIGRTSYRSWKPVNLTNVPVSFGSLSIEDAMPVWGAAWFRNVYREPFAESQSAKLDKDPHQGQDSVPPEPDWRAEYSRFPTFMLWSQ